MKLMPSVCKLSCCFVLLLDQKSHSAIYHLFSCSLHVHLLLTFYFSSSSDMFAVVTFFRCGLQTMKWLTTATHCCGVSHCCLCFYVRTFAHALLFWEHIWRHLLVRTSIHHLTALEKLWFSGEILCHAQLLHLMLLSFDLLYFKSDQIIASVCFIVCSAATSKFDPNTLWKWSLIY